jgi:endonuclease III
LKNATNCERKLKALLKKLGTSDVPDHPPRDDAIAMLVYAFLLWESTTEKADTAYRKIMENVVDPNDLRVTMPHEFEGWIGVRYPRALDRAQRVRACLREIYLREHTVSLERVASLGKRDVRKYVETLDGIVPFVAARLLLMCFDVHAMPVDAQLRTLLVDEGAADVTAEVPEVAAFLARHVKATAGPGVHVALQQWADEHAGRTKKSKAKPAGRTKKKTTTPRAKTTTTKKKRSTPRKKAGRQD